MGPAQELIKKSEGNYVQACDNFFRLPNRSAQEKVVASRSDCEHKDGEFYVDSGASRHMMSKNDELTSGENDTIERSKEPTVNTTANGKAESTEEATVYVNDLNVFVVMMLLKDSPEVLSSGLLCEEKGCSYVWKMERLHPY